MSDKKATPKELLLIVSNALTTFRAELIDTESLVAGHKNAHEYLVDLLSKGLPEADDETQRREVGTYFRDLNLHRVEHWTKKINDAMVEVASLSKSPVLKEVRELLAVEDKANMAWIDKAIRAANVQLPALSLYVQLNALLTDLKQDQHESVKNARTTLVQFADKETWIERAGEVKKALEAYLAESRLEREFAEMKRDIREVLRNFKRDDDRTGVVRARELTGIAVANQALLDEAIKIYVKIYALMVGDSAGEALEHWCAILPNSVPYAPVDELLAAFYDWKPTMEWARNAEELLKKLRKADEPDCPVCQKVKLIRLDGGKGKYPAKCPGCDLPEPVETLPVVTSNDLKALAALDALYNDDPKKHKKGKGKKK